MTIEEKFWSYVDKDGPVPNHMPHLGQCWIWIAGHMVGGYGEIHDGPKTIRAHRFSWELHFGTIPDGLCVLHRCDIRDCIRPDHLFLGTRLDNSHDARWKGRLEPQRQTFKRLWRDKWAGVRCGENIHCSKLTPEKVLEIRRLYDGKEYTLERLAKMFGIAFQTVDDVVQYRTWRHVK